MLSIFDVKRRDSYIMFVWVGRLLRGRKVRLERLVPHARLKSLSFRQIPTYSEIDKRLPDLSEFH